MSKPTDTEAFVGCMSAIWTLAVVGPMWLFLLYGILSSINAPNHLWVLFWCYLPAHLIGALMVSLFKAISVTKPQ